MNIIVCVKEVLDPKLPPANFKLDDAAKKVVHPEGLPPVINPYDAVAVELALKLKDRHGGKVTVLTLVTNGTNVVRHALAMGADDGVVLSDKLFQGSDSFSMAHVLTCAIRKIGSYDLVLCGRQAADWDEGLVGPLMAENLGIPAVTLARAIDVSPEGLTVTRVTLDGHQVFRSQVPVLVTVSSEVGQPRLPSGWNIIMAARKQIPVWSASDLEVDPTQFGSVAARRELARLFIPERDRKCEIVSGKTAAEAAVRLAVRLREKGIV